MELEVLKESKKELICFLGGTGVSHTFCNLLKEALNQNKNVEVATYTIDHPLVDRPRILIQTDGKVSPKDAFLKAIKQIKSQNNKVEKLFEKAIK